MKWHRKNMYNIFSALVYNVNVIDSSCDRFYGTIIVPGDFTMQIELSFKSFDLR